MREPIAAKLGATGASTAIGQSVRCTTPMRFRVGASRSLVDSKED